jgi:hypothetical protein
MKDDGRGLHTIFLSKVGMANQATISSDLSGDRYGMPSAIESLGEMLKGGLIPRFWGCIAICSSSPDGRRSVLSGSKYQGS